MIGMNDRKRLWKGGHSALKAPLIPHPALADIALMVNDPAAAERTLRQPTLHGQFHEAFALGPEHAAIQISQYCRTRLGYLCEKLGRGPLDLAPQRIEPVPLASAPATPARCNLSRCVCSSRAAGCQRTAIRLTPATARLSRSMRLLISSGATTDNPVALLPGRAKLVTSLLVIGSPTLVETIGIVLVACWAARAASVPPEAATLLGPHGDVCHEPPPAAAELPWAARRLPPCACRSKTSLSSI
jgi:hypothetical protein